MKKNIVVMIVLSLSMGIANAGKEEDQKLLNAIRKKDYTEVERLLTKADANPNAVIRNETPLSVALANATYSFSSADKKILNLLIKYGADVDGLVGFIPLIIFVTLLDNPDAVRFLIDNGADTLVTDRVGKTALDYVKYQSDSRSKTMTYYLTKAAHEVAKKELEESFEELKIDKNGDLEEDEFEIIEA